MKFYPLLLFVLISSFSFSQDFEKNGSILTIKSVNATSLAEIKKLPGKEVFTVDLSNTISQEEFDLLCNETWISNLTVKGGNTKIKSIKNVEKLTGLTSLRIILLKGEAGVIDVTPIGKLSNLTYLSLYGTRIKNCTELKKLTKLSTLNLYMSGVDNLDFISSLTGLGNLVLYGPNHTFTDYSPLKNLKKLTILDISGNVQATNDNLGFLKECTGLEELDVSGCEQITKLNFLSGCTSLVSFLADNCKVDQVNGLAGLKLTYLSLKGNQIKDIAAIGKVTTLTELDLSENQVTDLTPLHNCPFLEKIKLGESVSEDKKTALKKNLPNAEIE